MSSNISRALLLASVCAASFAITSSAFAASVIVLNGQTNTTQDFISGTDSVVINSGGTYTNTANNPAILWNGAATGAGVSITNNGVINNGNAADPSAGSKAPLIGGNAGASGTLTITNNGSMTSYQGPAIALGGLPATANVVITNNGTITNAATSATVLVPFPPPGVGTFPVTFTATQNAIGGGANNLGSTTLTNNGTINGNVVLGTGANVVNITTGSTITGNLNGSFSSNNTVNLSGAGNGIAFGETEAQPLLVTPPGQSTFPFNNVMVPTFYGWNNIQTLNVNSGTWSLVGEGAYNNLNIASGATFNICDGGTNPACAAYNGAQGTPQRSGMTPLGAGSLAVVNNGTLNATEAAASPKEIDYVPGTTQNLSISGSGNLNLQGSLLYLASNNTVSQGAVALSAGAQIFVSGTISTGSLSIDAASKLQVGTGGTLLNTSGQAVDDGSTGSVTAAQNVINAGTVLIEGRQLNTGGTYTQTAGSTILKNGGTLQADGGMLVQGGTFGGNGTLIGDVTLTGGTLQVGASPDALHIVGDFSQTGGTIIFEIDPDGLGGFLKSTLNFDPGSLVSITDTNFVFNFVGGADPLAFIAANQFNLNTFFSGMDFGTAFKNDILTTNIPGITLTGFDAATGAIAAGVPEPSTWAMMLLGFGAIGFALRKARRKSGAVLA